MGSNAHCSHCDGAHDNVPMAQPTRLDGELGAFCPHCGGFHDLDADDPSEIDRHPAVPLDEPVTCVCHDCNGSFHLSV